MQALLDRITIDREICFGKPTVRDTRIPVRDVLDTIAAGISVREILSDWYPLLDERDIEACILYAQAHPDKFPQELGTSASSKPLRPLAKRARARKIRV